MDNEREAEEVLAVASRDGSGIEVVAAATAASEMTAAKGDRTDDSAGFKGRFCTAAGSRGGLVFDVCVGFW